MPVVATSAYNTLGSILPEVLKCLNDQSGNLWTIPAAGQPSVPAGFIDLTPSMNLAYRKIQANLANIGMGRFKTDNFKFTVPKIAAIDPSLQVFINEATQPPNTLPPDLLTPTALWERALGSQDDFVPIEDTTESGGLPSEPQGPFLRIWEWRDDELCFLGATEDREVRMRYVKQLPTLSDAASVVSIRNIRSAFVYFTAALELAARGSPLSAIYDTKGSDALEVVMNRETRQSQALPRRRRPYSSRTR